MAQIDLEKMKKLLAQDIPQVAIAAALGCSESFISQCLSEEAFSAEVQAIKIVRLEEAGNRDEKLDRIEDKIVDKLEKSVNLMFRPQELLNAFRVINGAQRRGSAAMPSSTVLIGQITQVVLPRVLALNFLQNQNGEIIEAGGRSLTTLSSNVLKQMATNKQQQLIEVSNDDNSERLAAKVREPAKQAVG